MFSIPKISGQSLAGLAHKHLGSVSKFREIAELNNIDVLKDKSFNELKSILIPSKEDIDLKRVATPILENIANELLESSGLPSASTVAGLIQGRDVKNSVITLVDWLL